MSPEQIADDKDDYNTDQDGGQVYLSRARFAAAGMCVSESKKYKKNLNLEIYVINLFAHIFLPVYIYVSYSWPNGWTKRAAIF